MGAIGDQLHQDAARIDRFLKQAVRPLGQLAVREFVGSFKRQGWVNERGVFLPWKPRRGQGRNRSGVSGRLPFASDAPESRAVLVKSGRLRRSIRVTSTTDTSATIGTDVPYAQLHNQGGTISGSVNVRAHRRRRFESDEVSAPGSSRAKHVRVHIGDSNVKAHTRTVNTTIPQRQFMGFSKALSDDAARYLNNGVRRLFSDR
ncbi:phage virion morphogenesis protein [Hymenobacter sp. 15J16-1T3B]|uniref:phage virion morphogenesis protein n=1 Tax=Hymenobacter sp. 15J16-1T3B TaxID=2886941 RepID=UPI001D108E17|nr:phage virion morphogenesis protein [Hymenobacter sp. 15J16-1T3B]MCC3159503.1 phage virion morphogenesis protein [Hymenobacter sp. 15J16-1T3B]